MNLVGSGLIVVARQHTLAESIPWNRFLGSLSFYRFDPCRTEMDSTFPGSELYFTLQSRAGNTHGLQQWHRNENQILPMFRM
jgi:hypothetical protein